MGSFIGVSRKFVAVCGHFVVVCGIFVGDMQNLFNCDMWDSSFGTCEVFLVAECEIFIVVVCGTFEL